MYLPRDREVHTHLLGGPACRYTHHYTRGTRIRYTRPRQKRQKAPEPQERTHRMTVRISYVPSPDDPDCPSTLVTCHVCGELIGGDDPKWPDGLMVFTLGDRSGGFVAHTGACAARARDVLAPADTRTAPLGM